MKKITKTYVEKIYRDLLSSRSLIEEVAERNPMQIKRDGKTQGFRFFDREYIVNGGIGYDGETSNYSNWIYFGKRFSLDEIIAKYGNNRNYRTLISDMKYNGYNYVCYTQAKDFLPMEEGDMTFAEYIAKHSKKKNEIQMFENLKKHNGEKVISIKNTIDMKEENGLTENKQINFETNKKECEHEFGDPVYEPDLFDGDANWIFTCKCCGEKGKKLTLH